MKFFRWSQYQISALYFLYIIYLTYHYNSLKIQVRSTTVSKDEQTIKKTVDLRTWTRESFCVAFQSAPYLHSIGEIINPGEATIIFYDA